MKILFILSILSGSEPGGRRRMKIDRIFRINRKLRGENLVHPV